MLAEKQQMLDLQREQLTEGKKILIPRSCVTSVDERLTRLDPTDRTQMARGPDEWLQEVKTGQYLPENDMKKLCEMVGSERLI